MSKTNNANVKKFGQDSIAKEVQQALFSKGIRLNLSQVKDALNTLRDYTAMKIKSEIEEGEADTVVVNLATGFGVQGKFKPSHEARNPYASSQNRDENGKCITVMSTVEDKIKVSGKLGNTFIDAVNGVVKTK